MYGNDNGGVLCPNNWVFSMDVGTELMQLSWCLGDARTDTTTSNIQAGLLYPYDTSPGIYHCPSDMSMIVDANGNPLPQARTRSYNMSQSVDGLGLMPDPASGGVAVDVYQPCFMKFSQITNPAPSQLFVFIDENEGTLADDQFGYPMLNYGYGYWWDMPSNRHNQGASLSFADGHVERWQWVVPMIYTNGVTDNGPNAQAVPPAQMRDYTRVGNAMRMKLIDGLAD
jgi:prepilin-type processing-associated H-X9-DG protein